MKERRRRVGICNALTRHFTVDDPKKEKERMEKDVKTIDHIIKDTKRILEAHNNRTIDKGYDGPFPWDEYVKLVAEEFSTNERRIRRILRKAGLYNG